MRQSHYFTRYTSIHADPSATLPSLFLFAAYRIRLEPAAAFSLLSFYTPTCYKSTRINTHMN
jgi:hypothetical protein